MSCLQNNFAPAGHFQKVPDGTQSETGLSGEVTFRPEETAEEKPRKECVQV